ncbi:hypothetical protein LTS18_013899 [Coniosporium uncinatum]|uniref:Uncharacterized protein n=1 Tax=Coniosporium uncinatum TaxID=93489 RepID=A0ACC3DW02_9PEZI|nr:hypothetical protein LTS18_013899 [Coniosporium uncinatum]
MSFCVSLLPGGSDRRSELGMDYTYNVGCTGSFADFKALETLDIAAEMYSDEYWERPRWNGELDYDRQEASYLFGFLPRNLKTLRLHSAPYCAWLHLYEFAVTLRDHTPYPERVHGSVSEETSFMIRDKLKEMYKGRGVELKLETSESFLPRLPAQGDYAYLDEQPRQRNPELRTVWTDTAYRVVDLFNNQSDEDISD